MAITAGIYSASSPGTLITALPESSQRNWTDQLNDTGMGSLMIHVHDTQLASYPQIINYDNICRLAIDGTDRFAFIVENRVLPPAPTSEEAGRYWTLSGRGVLALLEDAIVYPEVASVTSARQRMFGWMSGTFNTTGWIAATEIQRRDTHTGNLPRFWGYPIGWPDPLAYWIWSRPVGTYNGGDYNHPAGTSYFHKTFSLGAETDVTVFASALNYFRLWLDGDLIFDSFATGDLFSYKNTLSYSLTLGAGTHTLAAEVTKHGYTAGQDDHPAGLICSVFEADDSGITNNVIVRTNSTWLALDYPANVPGMTVGEIIRILVEEAQARGSLQGITLNFDDASDSNASYWEVTDDLIAFDVGTTLLDVIRTFVEQQIDVYMSPTLELSAYVKGTLGQDLTGSVSLTVGQDFEEFTADGEEDGGSAHIANSLMLRDQNGVLSTREDATSLIYNKRKEAYIEMATAPGITQVQQTADSILDEYGFPLVQFSGRVVAGAGPYTVFAPGDLILTPNFFGNPTESDVLSLSVEEDEAGHPIYHISVSQTDVS